MSRLHEDTELENDKNLNTDPKWLPSGLVVTKLMPGGGDSQFSSLHYILQTEQTDLNFPKTAQELRQHLVKKLIDNPEHFGLKKTKSLKKQLQLMQFPEQLPSFEILLVFSHTYNLRVYVHLGVETPLIFNYREKQDNLTDNCIHL